MLGLVMKREIKAFTRSKASLVAFIITVVLILAAGVVGRFLLNDDADQQSIRMVVGVEQSMSDYSADITAVAPDVEIVELADGDGTQWLKSELEMDNTDAIVLAGEPGSPKTIQKGMDDENQTMRSLLSNASIAWMMNNSSDGLDETQRAELTTAMNLPSEQLESDTTLLATNFFGYITGLITTMLLMMIVIMGMTTISTGVVQEKSSRVVELILSSVKPRTLLLGKILGIGVCILGQFLVYIIAAIVALNIAGLWADLELGSMMAWSVAWVVVGFFLYALLTGALASTVSRQEDLGAITTPISLFMLVPLYLGMFLVPSQPDSLAVKVISQIPFFSSFMMPQRQAYDVVSTAEMAIALALAIVAIPLIALLAGKIYRNSVLRTGKRISVKEALTMK